MSAPARKPERGGVTTTSRQQWWRIQDLNLRPLACDSSALPTELVVHAWESTGLLIARRPVAEGQVGREHEAAFFVVPADDLEQQIGGPDVGGEVVKLVNDEQAAGAVVAEEARR